MDFSYSPKVVDLQKRLTAFMEEHIYPAEAVYHHEVAENRKAGNPWQPTKVMEQLRKTRFNDMFVKDGWLRADGLMVHDMHLMQVKTPAESKEPWDYYKVVETIRGEAAWTTRAETRCAQWKTS